MFATDRSNAIVLPPLKLGSSVTFSVLASAIISNAGPENTQTNYVCSRALNPSGVFVKDRSNVVFPRHFLCTRV